MNEKRSPTVSVIVPARNEEACLALCLESLVSQVGVDFEIVVVDDASSDRSAEIARSFSGRRSNEGRLDHLAGNETPAPARRVPVTVIPAPPLAANWTGKNNAMAAGAKIAKGRWLLFTDADTVHKPGSLAHAVAEAEERGAVLLSYSPGQEVHSFWERAVMPVIFAELAAMYPPGKASNPASSVAAANGQYLLISREAYDSIGGHATIAGDLLEDVAMARLVKSSGRTILFRYGGEAVRTRMYRSWAQMKEGWTKNLALLFPRARSLGIFRAIEFFLISANLIAAVAAEWLGRADVALATGLLAVMLLASFWLRIRRAHFSALSSILAPAGLPVFVYLLFRSVTLHGRHAVTWKGRTYGSAPKRTLSA